MCENFKVHAVDAMNVNSNALLVMGNGVGIGINFSQNDVNDPIKLYCL